MKVATIRQVRHEFSTVLEWIADGEPVQISKRGKVVAVLSPPAPEKGSRVKRRLDLAARLRLRDGDRVIPSDVIDDILQQNKGAY
jgi:antitoxin (DNA-binding transcriptional repressor) of toxin-antitoxin stability system